MVEKIRLGFNIIFLGLFIYFLAILRFQMNLSFILFNYQFIVIYFLLVIVFNIIYSQHFSSRLYFILNGMEDTFTFLKLKMVRKKLKSVFEISILLRFILIKQDKKSLDELYFYLKDNRLRHKTIIELYSVLISFREKEKASSLILNYKWSRNKWVKYCEALSMLSFEEHLKLKELVNFLDKFFLKNDIFTIYFYYLLRKSSMSFDLLESRKIEIRDRYYKFKNRIDSKHTKLLSSNLFFVVFYYIYDFSKKDVFY
ncbi:MULTISPECIES: hypothetical protein [Borreliella]|uniref:P31-23 n=1 Tax=Borrelia garinii subsp. bavariensis (strain ATCC BAA-2496 / DSM 23469 / PBi) TaxID=290434 RepID=A0A7I6GW58_BORGP|nr:MULTISPECIES: hypothetical protein [Borreliella]AAU07225.1 hypothetical protein BG0372 [Borreliella bavariensis PBi]AZA26759.1 hypothetical protein DB299_02460 [Borreliella bavariensis PBi]WLN24035.1 hypothetical protein IDK87_01825 [Borreliella bavariensis]